jgi:hypothetical protein
MMGVSPAMAGICLDPPGDITKNGSVDISDVQCGILTVLSELVQGGTSAPPACLNTSIAGADLNCDDVADVTDVLLLIQLALGVDLGSIIDEDGDSCHNNCELRIQGYMLGDGAAIMADDNQVLDGSLGTPRFVGESTDGTFILRGGLPSPAPAPAP